MSLELLHRELGWPSPQEIIEPTGVGASIFAQLAKQKLGRAISQLQGGSNVQIGVLTTNPEATETPLAIVCNFPTPVSDETLFETQRLAWNFSRSLLLITVEPQIIRKWSCYQRPIDPDVLRSQTIATWNLEATSPEIVPALDIGQQDAIDIEAQAAESLSWIELVSGNFFQRHAQRFREEQRADRTLLDNLKAVRQELRRQGLHDTYIHDLLARIIFVQFLFDRKDSNNRAALDADKLLELHHSGVLSGVYTGFSALLENYDDAYALFRWLNTEFNGDLFPGKGATPEEREREWQAERENVTPGHLLTLSQFVGGEVFIRNGQRSMWTLYSFDTIPLEFISSIYEEFVKNEQGVGVHYTPAYLVDLMLDQVLPWNSKQWNVKVLDPACGSGIFLVKAYQRLIHRWKYANPESLRVPSQVLKQILENNLFGVDKNPNAVRVASFSLYLTMCDEIDPRYYWSSPDFVRFPPLRANRIIEGDFFDDDKVGVSTAEDKGTYDIVVGNPPWGDRTVTPSALEWSTRYKWDVANKDFGVLFAAKGTYLIKSGGQVCLVQSASALLYNQESTARKLRSKVFLEFTQVESVINLANLPVFYDVVVPTCVLTLRNSEPNREGFFYMCPKPSLTIEDANRITIEPQDVHYIYPQDVIEEPWIWPTLMWGGNRDLALIRRLRGHRTLEQLKREGTVKTREGIVFGDSKKYLMQLKGRRFLGVAQFPIDFDMYLSAADLPPLDDPRVDSRASSDTEPFELPQLILKASWVRNAFRFQARLVNSNQELGGVVCSQSFISVHAEDASLLEACCACYNSTFANYYLLLTSGRFAFDRSEPLVRELRRLPIPDNLPANMLEGLNTLEEVDKRVLEMFHFTEADRILIDDLIHYTLPDYKGRLNSPGRQPTNRSSDPSNPKALTEPELRAYCDTFLRVLHAAYGEDKMMGAVIFSDATGPSLPVRMVTVYLNSPVVPSIRVQTIQSRELRERLANLYGTPDKPGNHASYGRFVRDYTAHTSEEGTYLTISIVKPDQLRNWTRSKALHDADAVAADLRLWATAMGANGPTSVQVEKELV